MNEPEVIFAELDTEVLFYGQPCGMIVATTLALANSVVNAVEIVYERTQQQQESRRPIIPSIAHWRTIDDRESACEMSTESFRFFPNCEPESILGAAKQVKGMKLCEIFLDSRLMMRLDIPTLFQVISKSDHNSIFQWNHKPHFAHQTTTAASMCTVPHNGFTSRTWPYRNR